LATYPLPISVVNGVSGSMEAMTDSVRLTTSTVPGSIAAGRAVSGTVGCMGATWSRGAAG
jgi:hypothetical protein